VAAISTAAQDVAHSMNEKNNARALVVFSGGQDSTTCLYWALDRFAHVEVLTFDYGQRHSIELDAARTIAAKASVPHLVLRETALAQLGGNSLTGDLKVEAVPEKGLPNTFVPGRNILFLTLAAAYAFQRGISDIVTGVCQTDFSGYPDCRRDTIDSLERTLSLGIDRPYVIHTPLMWLNKAETVRLARDVGALEAMAWSHTCYNGAFPPCETCPACELRAKGFAEAGIQDPLVVRARRAR
jgi:7-cyano-7-deazaguanine synthase